LSGADVQKRPVRQADYRRALDRPLCSGRCRIAAFRERQNKTSPPVTPVTKAEPVTRVTPYTTLLKRVKQLEEENARLAARATAAETRVIQTPADLNPEEVDRRVAAEVERILAEREALAQRKGVLPRATYRAILACLHPDRVGPELSEKYTAAFQTFKDKNRRGGLRACV